MRELVSLSEERQAYKLAAFLAVQAIQSSVDDDDGEWVVWIHNDDDREKASEFLAEFKQNPEHERYEVAERKVRHVQKEADRLHQETRKREIKLRRRWDGSWWHCYPATYMMIGLCVVVSLVCTNRDKIEMSQWGVPLLCNDQESVLLSKLFLFGKDSNTRYFQEIAKAWMELQRQRFQRGMKAEDFLKPGELPFVQQKKIQAKAALLATAPIFRSGEIWRFVTPAFIHLDFIHILFNMMWLRVLGTGIEYIRGTRRFLFLCLILALTSNLAQLAWSGPAFGGMSGVIFGLIGYAWMKGKTQPHVGIGLRQQTVVYCMFWMLLCMSGAIGHVANAAHLGGLVAGMLIGGRTAIWKKLPFTG